MLPILPQALREFMHIHEKGGSERLLSDWEWVASFKPTQESSYFGMQRSLTMDSVRDVEGA
jgi:hypothetical protein